MPSDTTIATNDAQPQAKPSAYVTLLTRPNYLPGVLVLAHSMRRLKSRFPLVVAITIGLPQECVDVLHGCGLETVVVENLKPKQKVNLMAERFEDTWTKLSVFGLDQYRTIVLLDSDMMWRHNIDELFDLDMGNDWIASTHSCVCPDPLRPLIGYPTEWNNETCPLTHTYYPGNPPPITEQGLPTLHLLNSGIVVLHPTKTLMKEIKYYLDNSPLVKNFGFPDQDLLAAFFRNRFLPISHVYNALKTNRYFHEELWRDDEVRNVHYIVEKPWSKKLSADHRDATTHSWWWSEFQELEKEMTPEQLKYLTKWMVLENRPQEAN